MAKRCIAQSAVRLALRHHGTNWISNNVRCVGSAFNSCRNNGDVTRAFQPIIPRSMATLAQNVKTLRAETNLPLKVLTKALNEVNNDIDAARKHLEESEGERLRNLTNKMSSREANQGRIGILVKGNRAAIVEIGCETDFVANTDDISSLSDQVAESTLFHSQDSSGVINVENVTDLTLDSSTETVGELVSSTIGRVGENVMVRRAASITTTIDGVVGSYSHKGLFGAVVALDSADSEQLANKLAMHIVANDPEAVYPEGLNRLLESDFALDASKTVEDVIQEEAKKIGRPISVTGFIRWGVQV